MKATRSWNTQRTRSATGFDSLAPALVSQAMAALRRGFVSALFLGLASTNGFATAPPTVTTVLTSSPVLALVAPNGPPIKATLYGGRSGGLALEWATQAWVRREQASRFSAAASEGIAEARNAGQKGVLLQVRYTQTRNFMGKQVVSPVGDGVIVVGAGPDANAVCYLQDCAHSLLPAPKLNAATTWTMDSGYYWLELEPLGHGKPGSPRSASTPQTREVLTVSQYDTEALQSRTMQLRMTEDAGYAYAQSVNSMVLQETLKFLEQEAVTRKDLEEITKLRDVQRRIRKQQVELESTLAQEFKWQAERAQTSAVLLLLGDTLSIGAAALTLDPRAPIHSDQTIAKLSTELVGLRKQTNNVQGQVAKLAQRNNKTVPRLRGLPPPVVARPLPSPVQRAVPINPPR